MGTRVVGLFLAKPTRGQLHFICMIFPSTIFFQVSLHHQIQSHLAIMNAKNPTLGLSFTNFYYGRSLDYSKRHSAVNSLAWLRSTVPHSPGFIITEFIIARCNCTKVARPPSSSYQTPNPNLTEMTPTLLGPDQLVMAW